jgi:arylsulfatase A-like enzyme
MMRWMAGLMRSLGPMRIALLVALACGLLHLVVSLANRAPKPANRAEQHADHVPAMTAGSVAAAPPATPAERTVVAEISSAERPANASRDAGALADLVVLMSVDGLRPDVISEHAPNIQRMQRDGSSAVSARTISKSSTLPSHASMVSGVDFPRHGLAFNAYRPERGHIRFPTIFSVAQSAGLSTALFVGKRKLRHLLDPVTESHFEVGGVYCSRVNKLAVPYLAAAEPGVVFLHFSDPDGAGHLHGWMSPEYLKAVRRADRCVGQVVAALERRGLDRTLVILTADHGGHDHDHAMPILPDTHIPWVAWGGPANRHVRVHRRVFNTDTAASILYALGLPMPAGIEGKPVFEALSPPSPARR